MSYSLPQDFPKDPKKLLKEAHMYETKYPIKLLLKAASGIMRNARAYDHEGAREDAFILFSRFVDLIANKVAGSKELKESKIAYKRNHSCKEAELYVSFSNILPDLTFAMERSEVLMNEMKREYAEYKRLEAARQEIRELQKRKFTEKKEIEEKERIRRMKDIQRRKSSMHSDDKELLEKLRSLSYNSKSYNDSNTSDNYLPQYPTLNDIAISVDPYPHNYISNSNYSATTYKQDKLPELPAKPLKENTTRHHISTHKTADVNHKTVNFTEGGAPLRTVFLPAELPDAFLKIANPNTSKKLETCGILVGKLNRNAFFITHLLIPEQDSTPDTCGTKNEEKMFEYIDNEDPDLFILGWIHTHPTQSCFLSSIDLHTQNSYQIMLNEAIAIVCSPSSQFSKHLGIFRLTDPPGIPTITNCSRTGFHPHDEINLYADCNRISNKDISSGHVVIKHGLPLKIKDLRK